MRVSKVNYQKIFPTGMAYLNHKIGVEIEVAEGEQSEDAFLFAKFLVEKWNMDSNPSYAMTMEYMKPSENVLMESEWSGKAYNKVTKDEKAEGMKEIIRIANTKQLLERQRGQVERLNNPEVTELFNNKLKTFE